MRAHNWMIDFRGEGRANLYRVRSTVVEVNSGYQEIVILDTVEFGRALFLDGVPQSAALDEFVYHEALAHPALIAHPAPRKVLVIGGGEGALLREVLKHNSVQQATMVDIDETMTDLARRHLTSWHEGAFDDPKAKLVNMDARRYLEESSDMYDCILVDATDPVEGGPAALLFTTEFFALAKAKLNKGGILAMQAETTDISAMIAHISIIKTLRHNFKFVLPYQTAVAFYGLPWGFAIASDSSIAERFLSAEIEATLQARGCTNLKFYDTQSHVHMFALPKYLRNALDDNERGGLISDREPLVVE